MPSADLTPHDIDILQKIKDPESAPSVPVLIDDSLPRDPHVTQPADYERASSTERLIIVEFQRIEDKLILLKPDDRKDHAELLTEYATTTAKLDSLIAIYPRYASAYNNKAQALRRQYGDSVLVDTAKSLPYLAISQGADLNATAINLLSTLDTAISLLTPVTTFAPVSSKSAKTLSQAYTQRGALFHTAAKQLANDSAAKLRIDRSWTQVQLEEMASRDFAMGGRYGNEIARALAVATNPTAKLCGGIVREAMRKEFECVE